MSLISWGKCKVYIKDLDATAPKWALLATPAEGTTTLETTKGEKKEAKIEGGENEDVRYAKSTYALNLTIRALKGRKKPIADSDGIIAHNYAVAVLPEDPSCYGILIDKAKPSVADTYSSEEGIQWEYVFDALKPDNGDQVKVGVVTVTGSDDNITGITCEEVEPTDVS